MDIRKFAHRKRPTSQELGGNGEESDTQATALIQHSPQLLVHQVHLAPKQPKKAYKAKLTYRRQWESTNPWAYCNNGLFCGICQRHGKPPANARGAWTLQGIVDWNHGTEMLKQHNNSKWHKDAAVAARIAEQFQHSVFELSMFQLQGMLRKRQSSTYEARYTVWSSIVYLILLHFRILQLFRLPMVIKYWLKTSLRALQMHNTHPNFH